MDLEEIPQYIQAVNNAQNLFSKCEVKVGFEADYYKNTETALKGSVDAYEFDYLIGVVHLIDDYSLCHKDCEDYSVHCDKEAR